LVLEKKGGRGGSSTLSSGKSNDYVRKKKEKIYTKGARERERGCTVPEK